MSIPISVGSGAASVAAEAVAGLQYQKIEVYSTGGTTAWTIAPDGAGLVSIVGTVPVTGSIVALGTIGASVIGWVPIQASNTSVISYVQNSVAAVIIGGSVAATFTPPANQSVSGTVGASVIGWVPIQTSNTSIITVFGQSPSIVGTYAEDAAHTTGDKGLFALAVRNDAQPSITSADGDYSPIAVGPTGAVTANDAPITKWIQGTADLRLVLGTSVAVLAAQGASIFTYVREIQVANFGPSSVLVTFGGGLGSILGYTIAPAGGGSNFVTRLKTGENSAFTASINGTASVLVSAQGFIAKI